jgi:DNA polymerase-1
VRVLSPRGRQGDEDLWLDEAEVETKWGVPPSSLRDLLALMGDAVDNVPGVPGVGEKTAAALIGRFGNLETLYERLGEVERESLRKKLAEHREAAFFSRKLVTVQDDLDLAFGWEQLTVRPPDADRLQALGERYELRRLISWADQVRSGTGPLAGAGAGGSFAPERQKNTGAQESAGPAGTAPAAGNPPPARVASTEVVQSALLFETAVEVTLEPFGPPVRVIDDGLGLEELVRELRDAPDGFVLDTETTSEEPMLAHLVGVGFTTGGRPAYLPLAHREGKNLPFERVAQALGPLLADPHRPKLGQNLKYDSLVLARAGLPVRGLAFDTMIASYLLDPEGSHGLDHLSRVHLGIEKIPTSALIGRGRAAHTMDEVSIPLVAGYCGEDVHCTWLLAERFRPQIEARELSRLLADVEMPLVTVLEDMELEGVLVDKEFLGKMSKTLESELVRLEGLIFASAGGSFNINSGPQLAEILFKRLGLPARKKTQSGLSTDAFVLEELAALHELPRLILQYRQVAKLKSTYVDAIPALIHPETGRVHTEFHQAVAATGRLSSSNPGLQNIPMRTPLGREVRKAFVARPGWKLVGADYSQIELRIMAHLSGDKALTQAFSQGLDVHAATAAQVFGLAGRAPTPEERAKAKVVNFGIMYGMGARALSLQMGLTLAEASAFIREYFRVHEGVKRFLDRTVEEVRHKGYVSTILGRRRYLPDVQSTSPRARANAERAAINTPLQGSAADLVKVAMVRVHERLAREGSASRLVLQVHDELLVESPAAEVERVARALKDEMVHAVTLSVPLEVSVGIGENWFDVH